MDVDLPPFQFLSICFLDGPVANGHVFMSVERKETGQAFENGHKIHPTTGKKHEQGEARVCGCGGGGEGEGGRRGHLRKETCALGQVWRENDERTGVVVRGHGKEQSCVR